MEVTVIAGVGAVHAIRIVIENKILNISRTVLRLMIPPFELGIPQIIHRNNTIAHSWVDFNMFRSYREAQRRGVGFMQLLGGLPSDLHASLTITLAF
jgi:hypothetical protein